MDGRQGWRWSWLSDDAAPNGWSWVSNDETAILQPTQHPGDHGIAQFVMKPFDPQARDELGNKQHCKRGHSTSPWELEATPFSMLLRSMMPVPEQYSTLGRHPGVKIKTFRKVTLSGFKNQALNGDYIERSGKEFTMFDRETYWSKDCSSILYFHKPSLCWTLAPAGVWAEWKAGFFEDLIWAHAEPEARIKSVAGWHEVVQPWTEAVFNMAEGELVSNQRVSVKAGKEEVNVHEQVESLLSTIPNAGAVLSLAKSSPKSWFLQICQVLDELPLVKHSSLSALSRSRDALDQEFWRQWSSILTAVEKKKRDGVRRAQILLRLEEQSRAAAEELIAEEEREKKGQTRSKKRQAKAQPSSISGAVNLPEKIEDSEEEQGDAEPKGEVTDGVFGLAIDVSDPVLKLRHSFPMFDDDLLSTHLMDAAYDLEKAVVSLSKLEAEPAEVLEPVEIPCSQTRVRTAAPQRLMANVLARTDHSHLPLYCFIAVIAKSEQQTHRPGQIVRPIPEDRFRLLGDEKGHFWLKKRRVPEVGDIVEVCFFEEDTYDYLATAHGRYPHQNEDLLCTTLKLHCRRCDLGKNALANDALLSMAVENVELKWPWKRALGRFDSVEPGKKIWYVRPRKDLPSVVIVRIRRPETVNFKYRCASSKKISVDFSAGRRLTDIAVTAAGFDAPPLELNRRFASEEREQLFIMGLARAERRGPEGYNRLEECPEGLVRQLNVEKLEEYCQILVIGVLPCPDLHLKLQRLFQKTAMSQARNGGARAERRV
ncbi:unnamed protein product [Durusdinium trenchii]|uniref:Uncharacterized protein n=1 Tax=Durusdinium trenchii TaxID=1381693 RepID=A0ABP0HQP8_9DINO